MKSILLLSLSSLLFFASSSEGFHRPLHQVKVSSGAGIRPIQREEGQRSIVLLSANDGDDDDDDERENTAPTIQDVTVPLGLLAQPVVWASLYSVVATGKGLPPGPFGLLGAVEGVAYLFVVGIVASAFFTKSSDDDTRRLQQISIVTLLAGVAALVSLVLQQGCVPNAKPLLDYSAYLPVCNPSDTPGLFGGRGL